MTSKRSSRSWPAKGMTLLELVVSLALVGTLLVGSLMAFGRHVRQARHARLRLEAVRSADRLLTQWFTENGHVPVSGEGSVSGADELTWQTETVTTDGAEALAVSAVRLTIKRRDASNEEPALASVYLVVPEKSATGPERNGHAEP